MGACGAKIVNGRPVVVVENHEKPGKIEKNRRKSVSPKSQKWLLGARRDPHNGFGHRLRPLEAISDLLGKIDFRVSTVFRDFFPTTTGRPFSILDPHTHTPP